MSGKGIYLRSVIDLLNLSESTVNKLIQEGHVNFSRTGAKGKRVFSKSEVQEFKKTSKYRSLKKQTIVVYLRCTTKGQERTIKRKVEQYCKHQNYKPVVISQLDRGSKEIAQQSYKTAINFIFNNTEIADLIYYGQTGDVYDLRKVFDLNDNTFAYNARSLSLESRCTVEQEAFRSIGIVST